VATTFLFIVCADNSIKIVNIVFLTVVIINQTSVFHFFLGVLLLVFSTVFCFFWGLFVWFFFNGCRDFLGFLFGFLTVLRFFGGFFVGIFTLLCFGRAFCCGLIVFFLWNFPTVPSGGEIGDAMGGGDC
jgi:hypothetical protein